MRGGWSLISGIKRALQQWSSTLLSKAQRTPHWHSESELIIIHSGQGTRAAVSTAIVGPGRLVTDPPTETEESAAHSSPMPTAAVHRQMVGGTRPASNRAAMDTAIL
jgi:hypothetical protein